MKDFFSISSILTPNSLLFPGGYSGDRSPRDTGHSRYCLPSGGYEVSQRGKWWCAVLWGLILLQNICIRFPGFFPFSMVSRDKQLILVNTNNTNNCQNEGRFWRCWSKVLFYPVFQRNRNISKSVS